MECSDTLTSTTITTSTASTTTTTSKMTGQQISGKKIIEKKLVDTDGKSLQVGLKSNGTEIIPGKLVVGNAKMAEDLQQLSNFSIDAVINLIDYSKRKKQPKFFPNLENKHYPIKDIPSTGTDWTEEAAKWIEKQIKNNKKTYIHCSQGMSRAPTLTIYYLMTRTDKTLREAFNNVKALRSIICPSIGFIQGLIAIETNIKKGKATMSIKDYSVDCLQEIFPSLEREVCDTAYNNAIKAFESGEKPEVPNIRDIEPIGYMAIDKLCQAHPQAYVKRLGASKHHPFD